MFIIEINNCDGISSREFFAFTWGRKKVAKISNFPVISPMPFGRSYARQICSSIKIMITTHEFSHRCKDKFIEHIQRWH